MRVGPQTPSLNAFFCYRKPIPVPVNIILRGTILSKVVSNLYLELSCAQYLSKPLGSRSAHGRHASRAAASQQMLRMCRSPHDFESEIPAGGIRQRGFSFASRVCGSIRKCTQGADLSGTPAWESGRQP